MIGEQSLGFYLRKKKMLASLQAENGLHANVEGRNLESLGRRSLIFAASPAASTDDNLIPGNFLGGGVFQNRYHAKYYNA